jgi:hypothetical protein
MNLLVGQFPLLSVEKFTDESIEKHASRMRNQYRID